MTEAPPAPPPGGSRHPPGLLGAGFEALKTRLDLAAVEIEIHLLLLLRLLVWVIAAIACALTAVAFAVTAMIAALWNTHRLVGLLCGFGAFVALAALFAWLGWRQLRRQPRVLEGSLQQLDEDQRHAAGTPAGTP
ncbi:MAG: phage holin family protein [Proteobacteria bacterium]|nr:phage holin family protein [Pseudomonadota bacterium]